MLKPCQPELAQPYEILAPHVQIVVASPNGGEAPLDLGSVEASKDDIQSQNFFKTKEALWKNTEKLSNFLGHAKEFEAIFFVGGHGRQFLILLFRPRA
jgi:putative intracellular protease/amidase